MCGPILLGAIAIPLAELYVLLEVGRRIGAAETLFLVVATAFVGLWLARGQGLAALRRLRAGVPPDADLLSTPLLFVAALLLVFPGLITDVVGLLLLIPPVRRGVARWLARRFSGGGGPGGGGIVIIRPGPPPGP